MKVVLLVNTITAEMLAKKSAEMLNRRPSFLDFGPDSKFLGFTDPDVHGWFGKFVGRVETAM